ncbi:MAG: hypothetical protein M5U01_33530 [Ardenticatenaceae bacterium]|nr:hypothetical protein [Ardenticatenaceae bacterium]HBY96829.1 hypothetical protein [Chloroflexota bacterium]
MDEERFEENTPQATPPMTVAHARARALEIYETDDPRILRELSTRIWETLHDADEAAWLLRLADALEYE